MLRAISTRSLEAARRRKALTLGESSVEEKHQLILGFVHSMLLV